MIIKPWTDLPAPRHTLTEEEEEKIPIIPTIEVELSDKFEGPEYLLAAPHNVKVLVESIPSTFEQVGQITISYKMNEPKCSNELIDDNDYDEDEQLYAAIIQEKQLQPITIPVLAFQDSQGRSILSLIFPFFSDTIVYNLVSRKILSSIRPKKLVTISPCSIKYGESLNKLVSLDFNQGTTLAQVPTLKPPHFITGISASVLSVSNTVLKLPSLAVVLDAEGQLGFEKIDNDSILDACFVLGELFFLDSKTQDLYLRNVSKGIRKFNSHSNSGMYI